MKIVGLTGGIGSGKTTIADWFMEKEIPVYNSDIEAKNLMNQSPVIREKLIQIFGEKAYLDETLNRSYIAEKVFGDKEMLKQLNAVVHPAVFEHFKEWTQKQTTPFVVKEAAILFESGSHRDCDYVISVVADENLRIQRVVQRDGISEQQVRDRIQNQMKDQERILKSDFVIRNDKDLEQLRFEFESIYKKLLRKITSS